MQSVPITTNVVSSNPARGEVYSIKFVRDLRLVGGFLPVLRFPSSIILTTTSSNQHMARCTQYNIMR